MKVMHLGDLHIGKSIFEKNLIEDQKYILDKIINIIKEKNVDVVIIAGDVYDKSIPSIEAINLLDLFLTSLIDMNKKILMIPGNHDSETRLGFGNKILENKGLIIESTYKGKIRKYKIEDVNFYLLPFIKPLSIRKHFEDCQSYNEAMKMILDNELIDESEKNILITHQFYTYGGVSPELSDSEINLGGLDNIDIKLLNKFNYVAMGHVHRPQKLYKETNRYSGSILKYSFSEAKFNKSVPIVNTEDFSFELIPLVPLRDMCDIKGNLDDLLKCSSDNYIRAILTDEEELVDPLSKLRYNYPNILKLEFSNKRYNEMSNKSSASNIKERTPLDLFEEFYLNQNNLSLNDDLREIFNDVYKEVSNETN